MKRRGLRVLAGVIGAMCLGGAAGTQPAGGVDISAGWEGLQAGEAVGTMQQREVEGEPVLEMTVTKTARPLMGRVGAVNRVHLKVEEGRYYDITFEGKAEKASVGLVYSLETPDGKVLARTTIPEIGRAGITTGTKAATGWLSYLVALHARGSAEDAVVTVTPIEPTHIELKKIVLTPREGK
ncbi:MAG: hypothetical protein ACTHN5_12960 [Phycisphaerae bacterium]